MYLGDVLNYLGSMDHLDAYLEGRGITGVPNDVNRCPLANYIDAMVSETYPGVSVVSVSPNSVLLINSFGDAVYKMKAPDNFGEFIENFDAGDYPDLNETLQTLVDES